MDHFKGKDPLGHVHEKRLEGTLSEPHGVELSGFKFSLIDGAKQPAFFLLFLIGALEALALPPALSGKCLLITGLAFTLVFAARSALLSWGRLERLHRLAEQERYEIEHHRPQERAELKALYASKGFKGDLLDKVVDVLMADDDRLLKVMLEEEMGLSLEAYEHPLKPAFAIVIAGLTVTVLTSLLFFFFVPLVPALFLLLIIAFFSGYSAYQDKNQIVSAVVWNLSLALLASLFTYFALQAL